ncbi:hypothetical protein [Nocardioides sp. GCM10030258]|uniref:hypothetical protein n=1 Tax=unclassified Nocardioides TaxID=2615069 RepID=UPI00361158EB
MSIKRTLVVPIAAALMTLFTSFLVAPSAMAVGSGFDYSFSGYCCINSREFDSSKEADVYISVRNMYPCNRLSNTYAGDDRPDIKMQLFQADAFDDTKIGGDKYIIDCAGTVKWSMVNQRDDLYVKMTLLYPHRDSQKYSWDGSVAYNGRTISGGS